MRSARILTASPRPLALPGLTRPDLADEGGVDVDAAVRRAVELGAGAIRFGDGEVLAAGGLPAWVAAARAAGARTIEIETSGVPLARPELARQLRSLGVDGIVVPLYGADADAHDWIAGQAGAQQRTLRGIRAARGAGLRVRVVLPVLRPTYRGLDQLVARTLPLGVPAFEIRAPEALPAMLWANPALTAPFVRKATALASAARREVTVVGMPACLLQEQAARAVEVNGPELQIDARRNAPAFDNDSSDNGAPACESCRWAAHCAKPSAATLTAFGAVALHARVDQPPRSQRPRPRGESDD
ncbi:MAG: radical SAM protein [Deltaproteobacteria bacterium]|nr:radical SAM protein [Deltaproteobacteria bacterium]